MSARKWTLEQRQKQKEAIQKWKPWEQSTGAKTPEGKAKSSRNSTKTGNSKELREYIKMMNSLLREQKNLIG